MEELFNRWRKETCFLSSITEAMRHPAAQSLLAMGKEAVPFLVGKVSEHPAFVGCMLAQITGENPLPPEAAGRTDLIAKAWIAWSLR